MRWQAVLPAAGRSTGVLCNWLCETAWDAVLATALLLAGLVVFCQHAFAASAGFRAINGAISSDEHDFDYFDYHARRCAWGWRFNLNSSVYIEASGCNAVESSDRDNLGGANALALALFTLSCHRDRHSLGVTQCRRQANRPGASSAPRPCASCLAYCAAASRLCSARRNAPQSRLPSLSEKSENTMSTCVQAAQVTVTPSRPLQPSSLHWRLEQVCASRA